MFKCAKCGAWQDHETVDDDVETLFSNGLVNVPPSWAREKAFGDFDGHVCAACHVELIGEANKLVAEEEAEYERRHGG